MLSLNWLELHKYAIKCDLEIYIYIFSPSGTRAQHEQELKVSPKELESRATLSKISLDYRWDSEREG